MKKKIIAAVIIIVVLVAAGVGAFFANQYFKQMNNETQNDDNYSVNRLPQLNIYSGEIKTGKLIGYTNEMDTAVMRDNLAVATTNNRYVKIDFEAGGLNISTVKFELWASDGERLVDNGELPGFASGQKSYSGQIPVSDILENNKEYNLKLILETSTLGNVYYYSRVMVVKEDFLEGQIKFAKNFSESTMDENKAGDLVIYMEPDPSLPNNNIGSISLKNNYALLTWGNLSPQRINEIELQLKEVCIKDNGQAATYQMRYQVQSVGNQNVMDTYDVVEAITVWTFDSKNYVLSYSRDINQVWTPDVNTVRNAYVDLGIQNKTTVDYRTSEDGNYISYVVNDCLWLVDIGEKQFTNIYKIDTQYKGVTSVIASNVYDDGSLDFIVCGYSTERAHMGKNGISVCHYNMQEHSISEVVFIPYNQPVDIMANEVDTLCYMNDEVLYVMVGDAIHYANIATKETGTISENLSPGTYAMNADRNKFAYNTSGTLYTSDSITVIDLTTGTSSVIEAGVGKKIKVCGYSGNNLVYGVADTDRIDAVNKQFDMNFISILDEELAEIKKYSQKKVYITDIEITDTVINIGRKKKGETIEDDQLLDNTIKPESHARISYYDDTKKLRELALAFATAFNANDETSVRDVPSKNIQGAQLAAVENQSRSKKYYMYSDGTLRGVYMFLEEAIVDAKEACGLITDYKGNKVWTFEENYGE